MGKQKSHSLLVVDDERAIVDSMHGLFRRDYNVFTATSAAEGLAILAKTPVQVILSDQRMPGVSGSEFLSQVKEKYPDTIRILVTGYADIEAVVQAVNHGHIYGYVSKPWKPDEIELLVRQAIRHLEVTEENRRLTAQLREANQLLEQKVQDRTRRLSELEQFKDCIIASLQSGLLAVDVDMRVETLNPAGARILELATEDVQGRLLGEVSELSGFLDAVTRTLVGARLEYQEWSYQGKEGETQYIGYGTSPLFSQSGEIRGAIVIFRDTTEKRRFEEQLIQSEKLAAIGELAGGVAHEINNPLGVILGFTQLLLKQEWTEPVKKKLKHIENQTFRCKGIVANLLKFARKSKSDVVYVNLAQIMQETLDILHRQIEVENVTIERHIGSDPILIRGNENELQQIFFNLILNAKDSMEGGEAGTLTVKVWIDQDRGRVSIADSGKGIPPQLLEKIWNPFFTTKPPGKGTGLGLSITRRLVERVSGAIQVESIPGQGTKFTLSFPLSDQRNRSGPGVFASEEGLPLKGLKILVVDDEEDILKLCGELLRAHNHVDLLSEPREVLNFLKAQTYDLLLLDLMMPGFNGLEVLSQMRREFPALPLPAVIITGGSAEEAVSRQKELGILDVVYKPFTVSELESSLRKVWERHKAGSSGQ